jgi:steroid delta-isomerase-like uncharacterized protein
MAIADELFAANYLNRSAPAGQTPGPDGVRQRAMSLRAAFPDLHNTIEDIIAEGDKVVVRFSARGTHLGTFLDVPATGKQVTWTGIDVFTASRGKLLEAWGNFDQLGLLRQLARPGS